MSSAPCVEPHALLLPAYDDDNIDHQRTDVDWRNPLKVVVLAHDRAEKDALLRAYCAHSGASTTDCAREAVSIHTVLARADRPSVELYNLHRVDSRASAAHLHSADCVLYVYHPAESASMLHLPALLDTVPPTVALVLCAAAESDEPPTAAVMMARALFARRAHVVHRACGVHDRAAAAQVVERCVKAALDSAQGRALARRESDLSTVASRSSSPTATPPESARSAASTTSPRSARSDKPLGEATDASGAECVVS